MFNSINGSKLNVINFVLYIILGEAYLFILQNFLVWLLNSFIRDRSFNWFRFLLISFLIEIIQLIAKIGGSGRTCSYPSSSCKFLINTSIINFLFSVFSVLLFLSLLGNIFYDWNNLIFCVSQWICYLVKIISSWVWEYISQ